MYILSVREENCRISKEGNEWLTSQRERNFYSSVSTSLFAYLTNYSPSLVTALVSSTSEDRSQFKNKQDKF